MFWMNLLKGMLKRPWIFALLAMGIFMAVQWTSIQVLKGDIVTLNGKVVAIEKNYNTCKSNEVIINDATDQCNAETDEFISNITLLEEQIAIEKGRVVTWRDKYNNKVCYCPEDEVVIIMKPDERRILNDETNMDAINRINDLFKP
jgi:hypothetical protein